MAGMFNVNRTFLRKKLLDAGFLILDTRCTSEERCFLATKELDPCHIND